MDVTDLSHEDCVDLLNQIEINLDALINFTTAQGEGISRQDIATMLALIRNVIRHSAKSSEP